MSSDQGTRTCPRCTRANAARATFCAFCGAVFPPADDEPVEPGGAQDPTVVQPVYGAPETALGAGALAGNEPTMAQSSYDDPPPPPGPPGPGPGDPDANNRRNWIIVGAIVAAAILIAGVTLALTRSGSSSDTVTIATTTTTVPAESTTTAPVTTTVAPTTTAPTTTVAPTTVAPPTTTGPTPQEALNAIVATLGPNYATSGVVSHGGAQFAAVSHSGSQSATVVDVYRFGSTGWINLATVPLTADGGAGEVAPASDNSTPITAASLTGSADPDFVVITAAADATLTSVVSDATGTWVAVPFAAPGGPAIAVPFGTVTGNQIRASYNNCDPDCADGTTSYVYFQYSNGTFQQVNG